MIVSKEFATVRIAYCGLSGVEVRIAAMFSRASAAWSGGNGTAIAVARTAETNRQDNTGDDHARFARRAACRSFTTVHFIVRAATHGRPLSTVAPPRAANNRLVSILIDRCDSSRGRKHTPKGCVGRWI